MDEIVTRAAQALARVREAKPLVLCITNTVVTNWTANCLLALGARPAMMEEPEEAAELAARSGAVLINLGTVTTRQFETMLSAVSAANAAHVPWVLDPVAVDKLAFRRILAQRLIRLNPTIIRGNHAEIASLSGPVPTSATLATGPVDEIRGPVPSRFSGPVPIRVANGVEMLTRVTGTGCAQGALAAAFCAVESDPTVAALAASLAMSLAGELAFEKARHPGSFQIALLDALDDLTPEAFLERCRIIV